ncbi:MAG: hypothetical protein JW904_03395 [Spirochaetales bacterium]|nr:hypothetical protein [Spirochaetales bacterium]
MKKKKTGFFPAVFHDKMAGYTKYILLCTFLFCGFLFSLFPDESVNTAIPLPIDPKIAWSVAITEFQGSNISQENQYLLASLPALLQERIAVIPTHTLAKEEITAYQKWIVYTEIQKVAESLNQLQKKQDEQIFLNKKEYELDKLNQEFETQREILRNKITQLRAMDPSLIAVPGLKELVQPEDSGRLLASPPYSPLQYAVQKDIDLLVTGSVEEIQGYLYLEIKVFHRFLEKPVYSFHDAGTREELAAFMQDAVPDIIFTILGREWAGLFIDVDPAFCYIKINNELAGMGTLDHHFLLPGEISLEIIAPGYKGIMQSIVLTARETERIEITLEKTDTQALLVESLPPGADVYFNALWIGKSPLIMERPAILSRLLFMADGFNPTSFRIGPESGRNIMVPLVNLKVDWQSIKESKRDRFFGALACLVLSMPVPIFSYGLAGDASFAGRTSDFELYKAIYYWSFFISGALITNMFYELFRYVRSADRPSG